MKTLKNLPDVTCIVPMRNSETTITLTLDSLNKQKYAIKEIIVFDNVSSDNSVSVVEEYAKKSKIPVSLIKNKVNRGVAVSYNKGVEKAQTAFVVFMHSDATLESESELTKLIAPLLEDESIVATYSTIINPKEIWNNYNFWQKCLFSQVVGKEKPGLNGKFDCIRRKIFLEVGGFDSKRFAGEEYIGGEDAELHLRLQQYGKIVLSEARVIHLHYLGKNYSLSNWIGNRKLLARTYGRLIRVKWRDLPLGAITFAVKPTLAILPFVPHLQIIGIILLFLFSLVYSRQLFMHRSSLLDLHILLLPFIQIFLVYYETFWMIQSFLLTKKYV